MIKDKSLRYDVLYKVEHLAYGRICTARWGQTYNAGHSTRHFNITRIVQRDYNPVVLFSFKLRSMIDRDIGVNGSTRLNRTYYNIFKEPTIEGNVETVVQIEDVVNELQRLVRIDRTSFKDTQKSIGIIINSEPINITERWNNNSFNLKRQLEAHMVDQIRQFNDDYRLIKDLYIEFPF